MVNYESVFFIKRIFATIFSLVPYSYTDIFSIIIIIFKLEFLTTRSSITGLDHPVEQMRWNKTGRRNLGRWRPTQSTTGSCDKTHANAPSSQSPQHLRSVGQSFWSLGEQLCRKGSIPRERSRGVHHQQFPELARPDGVRENFKLQSTRKRFIEVPDTRLRKHLYEIVLPPSGGRALCTNGGGKTSALRGSFPCLVNSVNKSLIQRLDVC